MAEAETNNMSNLEGALKPFSNTFDSIRAQVDAIIAERDRVIEVYPDQAEPINRMALDQINATLSDAGVSPNSYRRALNTEKQYSQELGADPFMTTKGIARALGQGIFLGAGDELEAFVTHMIKNKLLDNKGNKDQTYMEVLTDIQAGISAFERKNPGVSLTSEILGGLYFPFYTGLVRGARGLTKGVSKLGPGGREALSQGLVGAGAGTFYSYAKDRNVSPLDPLIGGGTAAGFSRALTKTGEVRRQADADIADIEKGFQTQVSGPGGVQVDAKKTIPLMTKLKSKLPNVPAAPGGPPGKPPGELGEAGSQSFHEAAMREIIQAADDEGVTFQDLMMRLDDYVKANLGEYTRMIDLVEEGGDLARTIRGVTIDNPKASVAKKDFLKRQIEAKQRTLPKIFSLFDPEGKMKSVGNNIHRWLNKSKETRQKNAQPLYEEFDRITLFDPTQEGGSQLGGQLWNRINTAMEWDKNIKKAWTSAAGKLAWNDPRLAHTLQDNILTGKRFNAFKKKLDGQIGELLAKGNLEEAGDLIKVKNEMIETVDKIVEEITKANPGEGVYQRARNIYSGSHASDNAFNLGTGSVKSHSGKNYSADEFEVLFDKLSDSEKAFTRLGLGQGIREVLEKDMTELTPNVRKLILGGAEPNHLERKFHYVFKDDTFEKPVAWLGKAGVKRNKTGKQRSKEFVDILNKEAKFLKSYRSLFGGSDTAAKMSDVNRVTNKISDVVDTVADLGPEALIRQGVPSVGLFSKGGNYISSKFSEAKRRQLAREKYGSEIAELLMTPGGTVNASKLKKVLQDLDNYKNQLDLEKGLLGFSPYKQGTRLGRYSLLQPDTVPEVVFPTDVWENK
tara:strand:- start:6520 stop:9063 length:2544 start_codon:yes stop_codon:yes gene_type:complete